jgi:hypothetical protein
MTDVISGFPQPHLGRPPYDSLSESSDEHWQQHLIEQLPMVAAQWVQHQQGSQMSGMHDYNIYEQGVHGYVQPHYTQPQLVSPNLAYTSEMETIGTPSTSGFDDTRSFSQPQSSLLRPPHHSISGGAHSPHSSHASACPREPPIPSPHLSAPRPNYLMRSSTAPDAVEIQSSRSSINAPALKPNSDDDDEYVPNEPSNNRGRKRQRIPHTAVERRYRENLNAHLDKLRQTVPALARRGVDGAKVEGGQGVKPSKCEILNGAIEHIGALNKEVGELKAENAALRARVEQMQQWYCANSR